MLFQGAIDHVLVGTPLTQEHYLNTYEGSIYGYDHDIKRFGPEQASVLRSVSGIKGNTLNRQVFFSN